MVWCGMNLRSMKRDARDAMHSPKPPPLCSIAQTWRVEGWTMVMKLELELELVLELGRIVLVLELVP